MHRKNRNLSIKKKAIRFLKKCFAILYHYILEYSKPPSFSLFHFVRLASAHETGVPMRAMAHMGGLDLNLKVFELQGVSRPLEHAQFMIYLILDILRI